MHDRGVADFLLETLVRDGRELIFVCARRRLRTFVLWLVNNAECSLSLMYCLDDLVSVLNVYPALEAGLCPRILIRMRCMACLMLGCVCRR